MSESHHIHLACKAMLTFSVLSAVATTLLSFPTTVMGWGFRPVPISRHIVPRIQSALGELDSTLLSVMEETISIATIHWARRSVSCDGIRNLFIDYRGDNSKFELPSLATNENYTISWGSSEIRVVVSSISALHFALEHVSLSTFETGAFPARSGKIIESPTYKHRGMMVDAGRRFWPLSLLKQTVDSISAARMNVLHFHMTDMFRVAVESKSHPELIPHDGQYLTHDEVRDLIHYAAVRGVRVIPEVDIPGHARGMQNATNVTWFNTDRTELTDSEETRKFLTEILTEFANLFPDSQFHLGGDETKHAAPALIEHAIDVLRSAGKSKIVAWEEAHFSSGAGTNETLTMQLWHAVTTDEADQAGFETIISRWRYHYLDTLPTVGALYTDIAKKAKIPPKHILGGEVAMWTDHYCPGDATREIAGMFTADTDDSFAASINRIMWPKSMVAGQAFWKHIPGKVFDMPLLKEFLEYRFAIHGCVDTSTCRCTETSDCAPAPVEKKFSLFSPSTWVADPPARARVQYTRPEIVHDLTTPASYSMYAIFKPSWSFVGANLFKFYQEEGREWFKGDLNVYFDEAFYTGVDAFAADRKLTMANTCISEYRRLSNNDESTVWFIYDDGGKSDPVLFRMFVRSYARWIDSMTTEQVERMGKIGMAISIEGLSPVDVKIVIQEDFNRIRNAFPNIKLKFLVYPEDEPAVINMALQVGDQVLVMATSPSMEVFGETFKTFAQKYLQPRFGSLAWLMDSIKALNRESHDILGYPVSESYPTVSFSVRQTAVEPITDIDQTVKVAMDIVESVLSPERRQRHIDPRSFLTIFAFEKYAAAIAEAIE